MFVGEYRHTLDEKGRVALPSRFRDDLLQGAYLTRGSDGCLAIYRSSDWEKLIEKIASLPQTKTEVRNYMRFLLGGAVEVKPDKQGRVIVPKILQEYASIDRKMVVVGVYDRIEIWDEYRWDECRQKVEGQVDNILSDLSEYGV